MAIDADRLQRAKTSPEEELSRRTRRAFLTMGASAVAGYAGWRWLRGGAEEDGLNARLRRVQEVNQRVTSRALFRETHLAPGFDRAAARNPRVNGHIGLSEKVAPDWRLQLVPYQASAPSHAFTLDELRSLPKVEHVTELKCVEGWSTVVHWGGARLADFTAKYAPGSERARYVGMETSDGEYYVGIDMPSALHPQTLLCYEMNGQSLTPGHGAPLRLVIPIKYGIKNIKQVGKITYADERPADYWAEEGYDYYSGL